MTTENNTSVFTTDRFSFAVSLRPRVIPNKHEKRRETARVRRRYNPEILTYIVVLPYHAPLSRSWLATLTPIRTKRGTSTASI